MMNEFARKLASLEKQHAKEIADLKVFKEIKKRFSMAHSTAILSLFDFP
jgi:hypothetical protein